MSVYIVTYDLNNETSRPKIVGEVDKTAWAKLSESSYAIDTNESPKAVYDRFSSFLDEDDNLYVITLKKPYYGQGPKDVNDWLEARLPR